MYVAVRQRNLGRFWEMEEWPKEWTQLLAVALPQKSNLKQCQNYCIISPISRPFWIMLRVILNRLKAKAEELLAEEQAGFRPGRSTVEQIFNSRVIIEKRLQHQRYLFHNFVDFKKAFDRVWPVAKPQKLLLRGKSGSSHSGTI